MVLIMLIAISRDNFIEKIYFRLLSDICLDDANFLFEKNFTKNAYQNI